MAEEKISSSLEALRIDGEGDAAAPRSDDARTDITADDAHTSTSSSPPIILCDAWYGFPTQKRPRKERINAVSRQLSNFLEWRASAKRDERCQVSLLGSAGDARAVHDRMNEIAKDDSQSTKSCIDDQVQFKSDVTIHDYIDNFAKDVNEVVYLSPDATDTLESTSPPPRIIIIGMLIDRRITTDRSRIRAEKTLKMKAVKLPLDELNVKELSSQEPLNVDTCMELMQRWWWNVEKLEEQLNRDLNKDNQVGSKIYKKCFIEAAAYAMKTQRERHPNRTVHKTNDE